MHADVSTCIAGWTGRKADMLPVHMTVTLGKHAAAGASAPVTGTEVPAPGPRSFQVKVARHRSLAPTLVYTALTNSVDMEGDLPEELTAYMRARVELEGHDPVVIEDTFSGFTGGRAPAVLYSQVASVVSQLTYNSFKELRIKRIDCETRIEPGRSSAEIEAVELDADTYCPGDTVAATVFVRPYKGGRQRVRVQLKLPPDLPEGDYTALICDEPASARADLRGDPALYNPSSAEQVIAGLQMLLNARRTTLTMRLPVGTHGVAAGGKSLPRLPGSMVHILANSKRTGAMTMTRAVVAREKTDWVIQGSESVSFKVSKTRKAARQEE
jgi:hypothetical protein